MADSSASAEASDSSYYAILNVPRDATTEQIKKAYRALAQTYHPDKQPDPSHQAQAAAEFARLQEAYEVLIDEGKREVYDVYGRAGLASGLQVGSKLQSREELRQQWQRFQAQQKSKDEDSEISYRGAYVFKLDASSTVLPPPAPPQAPQRSQLQAPLGLGFPWVPPGGAALALQQAHRQPPKLTSVAMNSSVSGSLTEKDTWTAGGQVGVRGNVGGGSFVAGLKRVISPHASLEAHTMMGLKQLVMVQSSRQLSPYTSAALALTWQPQIGLGMQVSSTRDLGGGCEGEYSWTVGPPEASGMGLAISKRGQGWLLSGKLEVGVATGISARYVRSVSDKASLRTAVKLGTTGLEFEMGASRRLSEYNTAGVSVIVGLAGVLLKVNFARGGQSFVFPVLLSKKVDLRVLAAAYVVPPVAYFLLTRHVIRPLRRRHLLSQALAARREHAALVAEGLTEAAASAELMLPVARRRLLKEAEQGGLVIMEAVYGKPDVLAAASTSLSAEPPATEPSPTASTSSHQQPPSRSPQASGQEEQQAHEETPRGEQHDGDTAAEGEESGDEEERRAAAQAEALLQAELPPQWLDVTTAVRFLVNQGELVFHPGVSKSGLMGFCDVAPGEKKELRILFMWQNSLSETTLADEEGGTLPRRGSPVTDPQKLQRAAQLAAQESIPLQLPSSPL